MARDGFDHKDDSVPSVFLQWKGTDACFDFHCECGEHSHFDTDFAYCIRCPKCNQVYKMPFMLYPKLVKKPDYEDWQVVESTEAFEAREN